MFVLFVMFACISFSFANNAQELVDLLISDKVFDSQQQEYDYLKKWRDRISIVIQNGSRKRLLVEVKELLDFRLSNLSVLFVWWDVFENFEKYINEVRSIFSLSGLVYDDQLNKLAMDYAKYMHENNHFSHEAIDWSSLEDRIKTIDYDYLVIWENLAMGYDSVTGVIKWRMDSPGHRANILLPEYENMWLGVSGIYWVNLFGKKR